MNFRELVFSNERGGRAPVSNGRCLIIAEVAQAHDGSLGAAHAYIDAVAKTNADAIKFQTHIAAAESTPSEPWRIKFSRQDCSRYEYWKRMEFSEEEWRGLRRHAEQAGLLFLSSPFSIEAVDLLSRVGVAAWKVASGELSNLLMFDAMARSGNPFILSTGMNPIAEIDAAVELVESYGAPLAVLQCTSKYPCPPEHVGLNLLREFQCRYECAFGLSDHSGTIFPSLAAATMGADVVEVHVTLSREMFGPDVVASVTTSELAQLVEGVRFVEKMLDHPLDKDEVAMAMGETRSLFTKSIVARVDLDEGMMIRPEHLAVKKPGMGLSAERIPELLNKRVRRKITSDSIINEDDFE